MKQLKKILALCVLAGVLMVPVFVGPLASADPTGAAISSVCDSITNGTGCTASGASPVTSIIRLVLITLSVLIGFVAVIMVIVNGFRFVTSGGDAGKVKAARSGIIYALIGLAVAALAQVMVHFVLHQVNNATNPPPKPSAATCKKHPKTAGC